MNIHYSERQIMSSKVRKFFYVLNNTHIVYSLSPFSQEKYPNNAYLYLYMYVHISMRCIHSGVYSAAGVPGRIVCTTVVIACRRVFRMLIDASNSRDPSRGACVASCRARCVCRRVHPARRLHKSLPLSLSPPFGRLSPVTEPVRLSLTF